MFTSEPYFCIIMMNQFLSWNLFDQKWKFNNSVVFVLKLFNPLHLGYLHCNEYDSLRLRWLRQTLESFIPQPLVNVIEVSELDGREMGDAQPETFDKVLLLHCDRLIDSQWYHCYVALLLLFFHLLPDIASYNFSVPWEILIKWTWKQFSFDGQHVQRKRKHWDWGL